jgi:hypothetical protein
LFFSRCAGCGKNCLLDLKSRTLRFKKGIFSRSLFIVQNEIGMNEWKKMQKKRRPKALRDSIGMTQGPRTKKKIKIKK